MGRQAVAQVRQGTEHIPPASAVPATRPAAPRAAAVAAQAASATPHAATPRNNASMLVATHSAAGTSTRYGTHPGEFLARHRRTVTAMAAAAEVPTAITRAAAQPAPCSPSGGLSTG